MTLAERMASGGYEGYAYSYPHKTAYRPLDPPIPLAEAWEGEDRRHLFLYVHLPFCEQRCGFCNLFTAARPAADSVERTLAATLRQSRQVAEAVAPQGVAQAALGGGTPTWLSEAQLERLFGELSRHWPVRWADIPVSVEASPATLTAGKLRLLRDLGVERLSLGVQSFVPEDLGALGRPQDPAAVESACRAIRGAGFPVFNLDLIYGCEGQDAGRWGRSLRAALAWEPEELYLYPLYVGRLTGLDRRGGRPGEHRRALYRQARDLLASAGYEQVSMRFFRRPGAARPTDHCCQEDGMVGLGPGARSYTHQLHYSTEYAVGLRGVRRIVEAFQARERHHVADYGVRLDEEEQRRRVRIKTLLRAGGTVPAEGLEELLQLGLAEPCGEGLRLNAEGLEWSDTIGPWLYSGDMRARMQACELS